MPISVAPIGFIGLSQVWSPEPQSPCGDVTWCPNSFADDTPASAEFVPTQVGALRGAGVSAELGVDWVLKDRVATSTSLSLVYGAGGGDVITSVTGTWSAVVRDGGTRFSLGPTWGVLMARGVGVASWYDRTTDGGAGPTTDNSQLPFAGTATMGGLAGSMAVRPNHSRKGAPLVETGGSWTTDGDRGYTEVHVRLGI